MSAATPDIAAIDAALARGEWWLRLFDELSNCGRRRSETFAVHNGKGRRPILGDIARIVRAVSLAIVAAIRLRGYLKDLTRLRALPPADLAAARQAARHPAKPDPAPMPIILAPWESASPTFLPAVPKDPPGHAMRAVDTVTPLALSTELNVRPWRPPRPG
jgi:hypothetical protein